MTSKGKKTSAPNFFDSCSDGDDGLFDNLIDEPLLCSILDVTPEALAQARFLNIKVLFKICLPSKTKHFISLLFHLDVRAGE